MKHIRQDLLTYKFNVHLCVHPTDAIDFFMSAATTKMTNNANLFQNMPAAHTRYGNIKQLSGDTWFSANMED